MKRKAFISISFFLILSLLFVSCSLESSGAKTPTEEEKEIILRGIKASEFIVKSTSSIESGTYIYKQSDSNSQNKVTVFAEDVNISTLFNSFNVPESEKEIFEEIKSLFSNAKVVKHSIYKKNLYLSDKSSPYIHTVRLSIRGDKEETNLDISFTALDSEILSFNLNGKEYDLSYYQAISL